MAENTKRRKVLAILAGGLVLGVGTAVTLAAWNDSEFASGDFAAGRIQSRGLDGRRSRRPTPTHESTGEAAAAIDFTLPLANEHGTDRHCLRALLAASRRNYD